MLASRSPKVPKTTRVSKPKALSFALTTPSLHYYGPPPISQTLTPDCWGRLSNLTFSGTSALPSHIPALRGHAQPFLSPVTSLLEQSPLLFSVYLSCILQSEEHTTNATSVTSQPSSDPVTMSQKIKYKFLWGSGTFIPSWSVHGSLHPVDKWELMPLLMAFPQHWVYPSSLPFLTKPSLHCNCDVVAVMLRAVFSKLWSHGKWDSLFQTRKWASDAPAPISLEH